MDELVEVSKILNGFGFMDHCCIHQEIWLDGDGIGPDVPFRCPIMWDESHYIWNSYEG